MMGYREIREVMEASSVLQGSGIKESCVQVRVCKKGQIVSDRWHNERVVGLVAEGSLDVYSIAIDGRELILSSLERGDCFGIINLMTETEIPKVLKCRTDATLLLIPREEVRKAVEKDQELALRYAVLCNRKMQFLIRKIEFLTMYSGRKRLIQFLLSSSGPSGRVDSAGTREDMASMLGISRASLFRELAALQEEGLICQKRGRIQVLNREAMEDRMDR